MFNSGGDGLTSNLLARYGKYGDYINIDKI